MVMYEGEVLIVEFKPEEGGLLRDDKGEIQSFIDDTDKNEILQRKVNNGRLTILKLRRVENDRGKT